MDLIHETAKPATDWPGPAIQFGGQVVALDDLQHPRNRRGLDLWQTSRGARPFPARAEFTPRVLREYLRNMALVRVIGDAQDFEFRIVGDAIVSTQGGHMQGLTCTQLDEVLPGYGSELSAVYRHVCGTKIPLALRGSYVRQADGMAIIHESLVMPLGVDDAAVDHLLVVGAIGHTLEDMLRS
jgi:hypothetical protein